MTLVAYTVELIFIVLEVKSRKWIWVSLGKNESVGKGVFIFGDS